jgi:hypothetical protein
VGNVRTKDPCGEIRRINVEIPSLSVSDMRRLKATQYIGVREAMWPCLRARSSLVHP